MRPRSTFALSLTAVLMIFLGSPANASELLHFKVYLDDRPIGEHRFRISRNDEVKRVSSNASFDVDFLFLNVYRYRHTSSEVFRDGCLQEIRATTDDNGKRYRVSGSAIGKEFRVEHQDGDEKVNGCLKTFAYWDRAFLDQRRLLNAQTGKLEAVNVRRKGSDSVEVGRREVPATRYALSADELDIDLWYNDDLGWVGLSSLVGEGRRLLYRRM